MKAKLFSDRKLIRIDLIAENKDEAAQIDIILAVIPDTVREGFMVGAVKSLETLSTIIIYKG